MIARAGIPLLAGTSLLLSGGCAPLRAGSDVQDGGVVASVDGAPPDDASLPELQSPVDASFDAVDASFDARNDASDAGGDTDARTACSPLGYGATVVHVDANAPAGGTGTAECPLQTITSALAAATWSPVTIQVAAGTYDGRLGEQFPLMLRGGVTVQGAGPSATMVVGLGAYTPPNFAGDQYCSFSTTFVMQDGAPVTILSSIGIQSGTSTPNRCTWGVYCASGNAALATAPATAANAIVDQVAFSGQENGVVVGHDSTAPSGCNMRVTSSTFRDALNGIWAFGYSPAVPVALDVEDTSFERMLNNADNGSGWGVSVWDNTSYLSVLRSTFANQNSGIALTQGYQTTGSGYDHRTIDGNTFDTLNYYGVYAGWSSQIDSLQDNTFSSVSAPAHATAPGVALYLFDHEDPAGYYPRVLKARRNTFVGNDVAIELDADTANASALPSDFGTASDPGNNVFRCNSAIPGSRYVGFDVGMTAGVAGVSGVISLVGNAWDGAPPTKGSPGSATNGLDLETLSAAAMDVSQARVATTACPQGRAP